MFVRRVLLASSTTSQLKRCISQSALKFEAPKPITSSLEDLKSSPKLTNLIEEILNLSLVETSVLVKELKGRLNLPETTMMPFNAAMSNNVGTAPAAPAAAAEPEKTEFKVTLEKFDAAGKAKIIREIKSILPNLNLVEAKAFVEGAPKVIKDKIKKDEAEKIKKTLEELGASVKLE